MMLEVSAVAVLAMGFVLGLKHATDADHVVAVTTFVGEQQTVLRSIWIGFFWGLGHTFSLLIAGLMVVFLRFPISEGLASWLELGVALMLILLGARAIVQWGRNRLRLHKHEHIHGSAATHTHWHLHALRCKGSEEHSGWMHFGMRPFAVGIVHGAAGSAALMLLVASAIPPSWTAMLYILIFGVGSIVGMLLISIILAAPLYLGRSRHSTLFNNIQLAAGLSSCGFGIYLALSIL